jgi:peptidoglycan/xylan/chitin deacetylase (PgdA/CDA1 family)
MMAGLRTLRLAGALTLASVALAGAGIAATPGERWVAAWATSQQIPEPRNALPAEDLKDATLRQIVRLQLGGTRLRVRFSNAFGTAPLTIDAATIAKALDPASPRIGAATAVTIHLPDAPAQQTSHPGSRATSYYLHGNQVGAPDLPGAKSIEHWYQLAGIETVSAHGSAVVVVGDSITDGAATPANANKRWPDDLQLRLRADPALRDMAVLNAGIGGNRLLNDGLGPNVLARFDREVLTPPGVTHMIVLEGVNDLGTATRDAPISTEAHAALVARMIGTYRQMIARAHAHGIKAIGATITPYGGSGYYHPGPESEADRQAINAWIRAPGHFDGVIDFDAAVRDPARPSFMLKADDSGDGLHPSVAGYQAMADSVPLALLGGRAAVARKGKAAGGGGGGAAEPAPEIAFTFDDLPAHASLPNDTTRVEIADRVLAALKEAGVPPIYGFVNGVQTEREPASTPVLAEWRKAGFPLGNHGWSHANLATITDDQFAGEVAKNEPLLQSLMGGADWHWFRYPFLSEASNDPARRERIRKLLAAKGYKIAPVTMSFADYAYNDPYARCVAKGDQAAIAQMEAAYLAGAEAEAARYRSMAHSLYGHDIPYVILMHLGAFDARMMPRLLAMYKAHGFRFVTLEEATRDPFYKDQVDPSLPAEPQGLEGRLIAAHLPIPADLPMLPFDTMCK